MLIKHCQYEFETHINSGKENIIFFIEFHTYFKNFFLKIRNRHFLLGKKNTIEGKYRLNSRKSYLILPIFSAASRNHA